MKLRRREIEIISGHISKSLLGGGFVEIDNEELLTANIVKAISDDLHVEDDLNEEVRQIIESHSGDIDKSHIEYHKVFNMVKSKLAKERGLIL